MNLVGSNGKNALPASQIGIVGFVGEKDVQNNTIVSLSVGNNVSGAGRYYPSLDSALGSFP